MIHTSKLVIFFFVYLLLVVSVFAAPPDTDNNGCVTLGEISSYVASWLNGGGVTLSQVSSGVSLWLNGCTPISGGTLHSAAQTLIWPPQMTNTEFAGAESNPTGNPIGGYYGYNRIVNPSDADYIVHNKDEFVALFIRDDYENQQIQPGDIVYVDDDAIIDLTGVWNIYVPSNVTIASGRGRGFSKGALIRNLQQVVDHYDSAREQFHTTGPGVRFTGLRFEGPDKSTQRVRHGEIYYQDPPRADNLTGTYYDMGVNILFNSRYPYLEVDNCELFGWSFAAVALTYWDGDLPRSSSTNAYIHHNYIHNNAHAGLGYGVLIGWSDEQRRISGLVEGNLFDANRHSIASAATQYNSYEARYNLVLPEGSVLPFDRHGAGTGFAGDYTVIHHNTDRYMKVNRATIGVSAPGYPPGVSRIYNNWVYADDVELAIGSNSFPGQIEIFDNAFNHFSPPGVNLPVATMTINKDSVKIGESITFSASSSTGGTYGLSYVCWNFGDRTEEVCGLANDVKTHSYSQPGRYLITLKAVDVKGVFTETTKSIIVNPSDPTKVILSFWMRDSYNQYTTNDASGYFNKQVLIDNDVVWQRDLNSDGWDWEHVVVDITNYVENTSVVDFQVRSLQNYQRQNYPAYHPFDFFEVYIDDIYIFNRDYSVENFGDWETEQLSNEKTANLDGNFDGVGVSHFYNTGGETWWNGVASSDDKSSGKFGFFIASGYRENSFAGSTRGIKQTIKAPKTQPYLDVVNTFGSFRDVSSYQLPVSFTGSVDASNNDVLDFYGYSKRFNGVDNFVSVSGFDLSRDYVLDLNLFIPYQNSQQTLMYATNGNNYLHIYYSLTNIIVIKTNSVETTCSVSQLSHNNFNKIIVGKSCNGAICTLSCASNGVVNTFTNPGATITLTGVSTVSFGGYAAGTYNLFGAIQRARILKGSIASTVFVDESKSKLQGAWYFRDGTGSAIKDNSPFSKDVTVPVGLTFSNDGARRFAHFAQGGPAITIPRDSSMIVGEKFSIEVVGRFNNLDGEFNLISGLPYYIYNRPHNPSGSITERRMHFMLKINQAATVGESRYEGWNGIRGLHMLENNKWYHLVFVKDGDYLNAYVNGIIDKKIYVPGATTNNAVIQDLIMGYFDGDISRLTIWDKTLTPSEIDALYASSSLGCSDSDNDGYGVFPRSGVVNGCRLNGFDCNDANAGVGAGGC